MYDIVFFRGDILTDFDSAQSIRLNDVEGADLSHAIRFFSDHVCHIDQESYGAIVYVSPEEGD